MHVVYLIIHKSRFISGEKPYMYIGSKLNWKGEGTYFGSSKDLLLKEADPLDLDFKVLWKSDDCSHRVLLEMEYHFQRLNNVVHDLRFFNKAYAAHGYNPKHAREKATLKFKEKANSIDPYTGELFKDVWRKRRKPRVLTDEERGQLRERLFVLQDDGKTLIEKITEKQKRTNSIVGEDGLTNYQRIGKKTSKWCNTVSICGKTNAEIRAEKKMIPVKLHDYEFPSKKDAQRFFGVSEKVLNRLLEGKIYQKTVNKFKGMGIPEEFINSFEIIRQGDTSCVWFFGKKFDSLVSLREHLNTSKGMLDSIVRRRCVSDKTLKFIQTFLGNCDIDKQYVLDSIYVCAA